MLHITNGDIAAELIRAAGVPGEVLPWRDVLHEGPVPEGLPLAELSPLRARFIADQGWGDHEEVMAQVAERDARLEAAAGEEVVLWFEHDLYDQLQLIQLLDHFAGGSAARSLALVCIGSHPGVERFTGLGQLTPEQLSSLFDTRRPVTGAQLELGRAAWTAFRSPDPTRVQEMLERDTSALPFLRAALQRHLEELPSTRNGLGCTQRQILALVAAGVHQPRRLFLAHQDLEAAPFLGDVVFWKRLEELAQGDEPLLRRVDHCSSTPLSSSDDPDPVLVLTERGEEVRECRADWVRLRGGVDRWFGGLHLRGPDAPWRWDPDALRLVRVG